jgi:hypothetical protein
MAETAIQVARATKHELDLLKKDIDSLATDIDRAKLAELRERIAILEERVTELKKLREEAEKRYWQFVVLFIGGLITLGINLVVSFVRK